VRLAAWLALAGATAFAQFIPDKPVTIHPAVESVPVRLGSVKGPGRGLGSTPGAELPPGRGRGASPAPPPPLAPPDVPGTVEQTAPGTRPAIPAGVSFDGLGEGVPGMRGGIDISLAVGPHHVFEVLNGNMAVFDKQGKRLYGPVPNNTLFAGMGRRCSAANNADTVVRYDQLANRWLFVLPVFAAPYAMCYAVSATPDPLGPWYRYEFERPLFPDYPRPAVWPDGYYNPTSTSDNYLPDVVTQKHECIADRRRMLKGQPASEQCVIIEGAVFMLNADVDGRRPPPTGAPNVMLSTGGTQLLKRFEDDGIYSYDVHVDWRDPAKTSVSQPRKIAVAAYRYLCDGQLSNCVSQPGTERRLDSQGDKLMQRLVYRNFGDHESLVAEHSVATAAHGGGVRWYEFRLDAQRRPVLYQQSTYAPDGLFRWLASMGMDRKGDIGIGYSFGGAPNYPGQRFAARLAADPKGQLTFQESVLAAGAASQTNSLRWEDYTTLALDPADDCTFWFVGNYLKAGATSSTTRIGSFAVPGCR
jgi:hypothetical protein